MRDIIKDRLIRYWRWKAEGEEPFGEQYYYPEQFSRFVYNAETDTYDFNIMLTNGVWLKGVCKYTHLGVEILGLKKEYKD